MNKTVLKVSLSLVAAAAAGVAAALSVVAPAANDAPAKHAPDPGAAVVAVSPEEMAYADALARVRPGGPESFRGLTVFPFMGSSAPRRYITLDEALKDKAVEITDTGRVEDVSVVNRGTRSVLIVDGEEIVGAKQNRVFNSSLMVPPGKTVVAKVSCVEQGRWSTASAGFSTAGTQLFAGARQMNSAAVAGNMEVASAPRGDQTAVWDKVARKNEALGVPSETRAMHRAYETRKVDLDAFVERFQPQKGQTGAVFAIRGEVIGMDLFDSADTLNEIYPKLIRSYALDAIAPDSSGRSTEAVARLEDAREFLAAARAARGKSYESQGEGRDLRVSGWKISGACLIVKGAPVHTAVFAGKAQTAAQQHGTVTPMAPPSDRRR